MKAGNQAAFDVPGESPSFVQRTAKFIGDCTIIRGFSWNEVLGDNGEAFASNDAEYLLRLTGLCPTQLALRRFHR